LINYYSHTLLNLINIIACNLLPQFYNFFFFLLDKAHSFLQCIAPLKQLLKALNIIEQANKNTTHTL